MKILRNVTDFDAGSDTPQGAVGAGTLITAGDLTGSHAAPKVAGIAGVTVSGTPVAGEALVTTSGTAASWASVVTPNPLTTEGDIIYQHSGAPTRLAVGATNTLLHGGTDPSYSAVVEADITLANNTTNNVSISKHGFVPIAPNDATKFLDGTGAFSVPAGGGGGISQSFVGYNTIGGTWTTLVNRRYYCKSITLANASTFTSIDAYLRPSTDNVGTGLAAVIMSDNSGAPSVLLAASQMTGVSGVYLSNSSSMPGAGRWLSFPIGTHLAAGTYWICLTGGDNSTFFDMANDGSGSDQTFTTSASLYITGAYPSVWTLTTGSVKWSIRASILS